LVPVTDGKERRLTSGEGWINGVTWTPGGDEVVFASTRAKAGNQAGIWRVSAVEGRPADPRLATIGTFPRNLPVNPALAGNRLVFEGENFRSTVWKMPLRGGASLPVRVFGSGHGEETPTYSPDGKRLAFFYSRRGDGHHDIATANIDGSHLEQITTQGLLFTRRPSWSPDGSKVAYNANVGGRRCLFVVPSAGGEGRRMPIGDFDAGRPSWSHDGRWIYFSCDRSGSLQIWKIPADGSREPIQITRGGGVEAIESSTGGLLYFLRSDDSGKVFTVPALGGREEPLEGSPIIHAGYWSYARNQIYFFNLGQDRTGLDRFPVQRFHPVTQRLETVGWIEGSDLLVPEISVRADGKEVLWCKRDLGADLFMLENLR
jgi:Tol biopolymer transport system component